ncbi:MAG: hypothetical protein U0572_06180 [Phycisphaerales bacterium]
MDGRSFALQQVAERLVRVERLLSPLRHRWSRGKSPRVERHRGKLRSQRLRRRARRGDVSLAHITRRDAPIPIGRLRVGERDTSDAGRETHEERHSRLRKEGQS